MKPCFIIAHKYFRGHESYTEYYIQNILNFYEDALIVVVDNNSVYKDDIFDDLKKYKNVVLLDNDIESKFELGAYRVGISYLVDNDLLDTYDYCIFTQDNFIIKNYLDFEALHQNTVKACQINTMKNDWERFEVCRDVLGRLNLLNNLEHSHLCWCCSFICATEKVRQLGNYLSQIVMTTRYQSTAAERYLGRIILELNDGRPFSIDGDIMTDLPYDCWTVDLRAPIEGCVFAKTVQQKNECTVDK